MTAKTAMQVYRDSIAIIARTTPRNPRHAQAIDTLCDAIDALRDAGYVAYRGSWVRSEEASHDVRS